MKVRVCVIAVALLLGAVSLSAGQSEPRHNVVLFVPDGLRAEIVDPATAPTMSDIRDRGVNFANPHSLFPTFPTANASAMATGHYLGDTGDFSNTINTGFPVETAVGSITPFLEADTVIDEVDDHFGANYLDEEAILEAAREAGLGTPAIGKLGPAYIFDHTARDGKTTIVVDDATARSPPPAFRPRPRAAAPTATPAARRSPAPRSPTSSSRTGSPMSRPRQYCRSPQEARSAVRHGVLVARPGRHPAFPG